MKKLTANRELNISSPPSNSDLRARINALREELENRHKYGMVKMADADGKPIPVKILQEELFALLYKKSRLLNLDE